VTLGFGVGMILIQGVGIGSWLNEDCSTYHLQHSHLEMVKPAVFDQLWAALMGS